MHLSGRHSVDVLSNLSLPPGDGERWQDGIASRWLDAGKFLHR